MVTDRDLLKLVRGRRYSPMTREQLARALDVPQEEMQPFDDLVRELELAGELVEVKNKQLADPERVDLVVGKLGCNPRGFGFVRPMRERDGEDMYIGASNMSSALHGDIVVVRVPPSARRREESFRGKKSQRRGRKGGGDRPEIKIVSVLQRGRTEIVGTFRQEGHMRFVVPDDPRLFRDVMVAAEDAGEAQLNDKVAVRITVWPSRHINPAGVVSKVFGQRGDLEAERLSVIHEYNLRSDFPEEVVHAAEKCGGEVSPADLKRRADLTAEEIFTIDPEDARDFDDAVSIRRLGDGWEIGVHIADVSHYVKADGPLDREARARGTSVYLPGQVIPMLPEALSNNLCSLQPHQVRLTKTVRMRVSAQGELGEFDVYDSFIRSIHRFNYKEVQKVLEGEPLPAGQERLQALLLEMHKAAQTMRGARRRAGMIEMDIPESHIITDDAGRTIGVELRRSDPSHQLIEQFMLAANECVAGYLIRHHLPYICRAHDEPEPESLADFRATAKILGHNLPAPGTRAQIQKFLDRLVGKPDAYLLNYLLLRSMKMAEYSADYKQHYAIAADHYLHFTSPIRRYPDLLVHRVLQEHWGGRLKGEGRVEYWRAGMPVWAAHATETERNAQMAERSINTRRLLEFVGNRKTPMDAVITSVENYGLRLHLREFLLDGVIRLSALSDSFYRVDKEQGTLSAQGRRGYKVGQVIQVRVLHYNELKHQIEFEPVQGKNGR